MAAPSTAWCAPRLYYEPLWSSVCPYARTQRGAAPKHSHEQHDRPAYVAPFKSGAFDVTQT